MVSSGTEISRFPEFILMVGSALAVAVIPGTCAFVVDVADSAADMAGMPMNSSVAAMADVSIIRFIVVQNYKILFESVCICVVKIRVKVVWLR